MAPLIRGVQMHETEESRILRLRSFLNNLDVSEEAKGKIEDFFIAELREKNGQSRRKATFSVGEDDFEEIAGEVNASLHKESKEVETQCPEKVNMKASNSSLEELSEKWKAGEEVCPGDVVRLMRRNMARARDVDVRYKANKETAMRIRRELVSSQQKFEFQTLPLTFPYDYSYVESCCENILGNIPIPIGYAGPLTITDGNQTRTVYVPMATTEGALVASTNRGCSAIMKSAKKSIFSVVTDDKMTRAPVVAFSNAEEAVAFKSWLNDPKNFAKIKSVFESTSGFCRLKEIKLKLAGDRVYVKFCAVTGDAMGMNMISKACQAAIDELKKFFPSMRTLALSGNYCVDKKPSAINWIEGRGKTVVAQAVLPAVVVKTVLKTTPQKLAETAHAKLNVGSSMAGCIGGNNAQAANVVAAIFLATGQDPAQVVSSSMCETQMEVTEEGDLKVSTTMNCVEVGTVGGGTILPPQNECLKMLACSGPNRANPGSNAKFLAEVICATVLAGELSLMAALCTEDLVSSHMTYNRSKLQLYESNLRVTHTTPVINLLPAKIEDRPSRSKHPSESIPGCSNIL